MRKLWLVLALLFGCATTSNQNGAGEPPEAALEAHVAMLRTDLMPQFAVGRLPRDLSVPKDGGTFQAQARRPMAISAMGAERTGLDYLGAAEDRLCFKHTAFRDPADATPVAQVVDAAKLGEATWIEFVDSLDALAGRSAWPPGPAATSIDSVAVVGDKVETFDRKKDLGGGESLTVKEEKRVVELKLCGAKPKQAATSRYLIAVSHRLKPSADESKWDPQAAEASGPSYRAAHELKNNALLVWALTDDGTFDLSK